MIYHFTYPYTMALVCKGVPLDSSGLECPGESSRKLLCIRVSVHHRAVEASKILLSEHVFFLLSCPQLFLLWRYLLTLNIWTPFLPPWSPSPHSLSEFWIRDSLYFVFWRECDQYYLQHFKCIGIHSFIHSLDSHLLNLHIMSQIWH